MGYSRAGGRVVLRIQVERPMPIALEMSLPGISRLKHSDNNVQVKRLKDSETIPVTFDAGGLLVSLKGLEYAAGAYICGSKLCAICTV